MLPTGVYFCKNEKKNLKIKKKTPLSVHHAGAGVFGHLSDSFLGRKGSLQVVCVLNAAFGLLTALSPTYWAYAALRLLTGFSTGSVGVLAFVLATEPVGPARRGAAGMSTFYFFSGGIAALAGVAALVPGSWRTLYVVTSLPSLAFAVAVVPFVSESPRWYLVRRRPDDALRVIRAIAAANGRTVPDDLTLKLDDEDEDDEEEDKQAAAAAVQARSSSSSGGSIVDVFRSRTMRVRLVLSVLINLLTAVVYYGLSLNVVNLKTNLYVSVVANSLAEMPAYLLTALLLDRFGRKPLAIGTMLLSGVFCTAGSLIAGEGVMRSGRQIGFNASFKIQLFSSQNVTVITGRTTWIILSQGCPHGVRRGGHLRHGGHVQPALHLHGGAVPDGGAQRGAGVHGAGVADGGHRGAARGGARGAGALRGLRRLGHRRRPARLLPARDDEQAPLRHHGGARGRREEPAAQVTPTDRDQLAERH